MVRELKKLGKRRYVGDSRTGLVHDRWHADCQGCGIVGLVRDGHAVGFEPDTLDGAFWAGYDYCEACIDRTEPAPPKWAKKRAAEGDDEHGRGPNASTAGTPPRGHEPLQRQALEPEREKIELEV